MSETLENDWELQSNDDNGKVENVIKNLPVKSKEKYEAVYQHFTAWQASKELNTWTENVLLSYFGELIGKVKPPTLWARYSMLKSTIKMNNNIDISCYTQLSGLLRKESKGYKSKKPKTLTSKEILDFLNNAPDHNYLATKVAIIFGICGALKKGELCEIRTTNIKDFGTHLVIKVINSETRNERTFFVHGELFYNLYKAYAALRPRNIATTRFFVNYNYGKCTQQVIGINKFGAMPKQVAKYLNLPNSECYTGHSIRRTSATILADLGAATCEVPYKRLAKQRNRENSENNTAIKRAKIDGETTNFAASSSNNRNDTNSKQTENGWPNCFRRNESKDNVPNSENGKNSKVSIQHENLPLDNLYNADESLIQWRPIGNNKIHDGNNENYEKISDGISILFCANATGSHRIPLLTLGNCENPECLDQFMDPEMRVNRLKLLKNFNVAYTHESRSRMDKNIFLLWYKEIFIPNVTEHQKKSGISGKVVLIIDNDPCHPPLNELNSINKNFQILPLPSNMTVPNQPMNQGLVSLTKKHYKNNLLKQALLSRLGTENYIKQFNLNDSLELLGEAWDNLESAILKKVWKAFLSESNCNLQDPLTTNNSNNNEALFEESTSFLQNKGDQLSQHLTESTWSTNETKEKFLKWFNNNDDDIDDNKTPIANSQFSQNESTNMNDMQKNYIEMKNDFAELRNEFAELRSKFAEIKNELKCGNHGRTRKVTQNEDEEVEEEAFDDSMNFEDCMENEFLHIKDEIDDDEDDDNDDEDVENIEIEESKSFLDDTEKTLIAAFTHFNELKEWMKLSNKFTTKHFDYMEEIESVMKQET